MKQDQSVQITRIETASGDPEVDRQTRKIEIVGTVFPPNSRVQAFIRGGDAEWYVQGDVAVDGHNWRAPAAVGPHLGEPQAPYGVYAVTAVIGYIVPRGGHVKAADLFPGRVFAPWRFVERSDAPVSR